MATLILGGYVLIRDLRARGSDPNAEDSLAEEFEESQPIGYVDAVGVLPAPTRDSVFYPLIKIYPSEGVGKSALDRGEIQALYVLHADYLQTGTVTQWLAKFDLSAMENNLMESYLLYTLAGDSDPLVVTRLRQPMTRVSEQRINAANTGETQEASFGASFIQIYIFALLMMFAAYGSSGYLMMSVVNEKESKTLEILLTSVRPLPLLLGKILALGSAGLITTLVWLIAALVLVQQAADQIVDLSALEVRPQTLLIALIYFALGYGFMGGLFAGLGAVTNTVREGSTLAGWFVFPVIVPLFVINTFVENPNGPIPVALSLIPITAPLAMVMRASLTEIPLGQLLISVILMLFLVAFSIWLASRLFRVTSLLRGTTPRLRDLPRLLWEG
jgi:ABC-2 type transport system permease protein